MSSDVFFPTLFLTSLSVLENQLPTYLKPIPTFLCIESMPTCCSDNKLTSQVLCVIGYTHNNSTPSLMDD
uniref:Uncharacterized protein n=1 Tax=Cucumis melo TaxID=3656 RepID=A0A9I9EH25_CUCME